MMKNVSIIKSLMVAAVMVMAACTPHIPIPNAVGFSVGETVGHKTKQQFLTITSEQAWTITLEYVAPEGVEEWCSLSKMEGEGNANIFMTFGENPLVEDRVVNINVQFLGESICATFTQRSALHESQESDLSGWLELPTFEEDGTRYYFSKHMLPSKGDKERSFSIFYDADIYHPHWIAYPLCKGNISGAGKRQHSWGIYDPNIRTEKQLYMKYSFSGNYDRGHMLPSASRLGSNADNRQTFYPTNMSPQLDDLNQQKWAGIEIQVRDWAYGCDTLYVVTGAVFQTVGGNETVSYTHCNSDSSKDVAIPNYYYKALLQRHGTGDGSSFKAVAIWVPHKAAYGEATRDDMITIDRLEELTGIDFFHNLDDATEQKVESEIETRYWGL